MISIRCGIGRALVLAGVLVLLGTGATRGNIVHVSTAGDDANDGLTWETARRTVQAGLDAVTAGDQVWVAAGTYVETITLAAEVELYGGFAGDEETLAERNWRANPTILDGNQAGSVVTAPPGATQATRIDGFTIRNGTGTPAGPYNNPHGGGIYCSSSSLTIANNTITENIVSGNGSTGGGIACLASSSATIVGNTIRSNSAWSGAGVGCNNSSAAITGNMISGNTGEGGAGVHIYFGSATISNNAIIGNTVHNSFGAGIYCWSSSVLIVNNTIAGNNSGSYGGGITCGASTPEVAAYTICNNTIIGNSGGVYSYTCSPTIVNSIIAFNSFGIYKHTEVSGTPLLRSNCVYGNLAGDYTGLPDPTGTNGNISADPRLPGISYRNSHIQPDSPCIDAGDDSLVQSGWLDMESQPRIAGGRVDIGADESDGTIWPQDPSIVIRVSPQGDDANDGSTWPLAKRTVQGALVAAVAGDQVWVAAGIYLERIKLKPEVALYGGFAGDEETLTERDWLTNTTILDAGRDDTVVVVSPGASSATRIDGFTVRNGGARGIDCFSASATIANNMITGNGQDGISFAYGSPIIEQNIISNNGAPPGYGGSGIACAATFATIRGNTITGNRPSMFGGGIDCISASPAIINNTIRGNSAGWGAGICCSEGSSPEIIGNTISGNGGTFGGGILCEEGSSPTITGNVISGNGADWGGGIRCEDSSPMISHNTITDNVGTGGGIYCDDSGSPIIANNLIARNRGSDGGGIACDNTSPVIVSNTITGNIAFSGAGIDCWKAAPIIAGNAIVGNIAGWGSGGAIYSAYSPAVIVNNTIVGNASSEGGTVTCSSSPAPTISNTIIAFNATGISAYGDAPTLQFCCVYGNTTFDFEGLADPTGTNGNIAAAPRFVRPASPGPDATWGTADDDYGDLHLLPGSSCIDAGSNADVPADAADLDGDGDTAEPLPVDLAGANRFADDPYRTDTGRSPAPVVDMGAYEHRCGDVDGDGVVDKADLLRLADAFGTDKGDLAFNAGCDFNTDGMVDVADLLDIVYDLGQ